ncbi:MAG: hypothetical protein IJH04_03280 [Eggerthellaceae bacterium]|nr:hypothetical protein [Eggerthellaceae bacterium]
MKAYAGLLENETFRKIVAAYQTQLVAEFMLVDYKEIYYPAFAYDSDIGLTAEKAKEISAYASDREGKTTIGDTLIVPLTMYSTRFDSLDALKEAAGEKAR